MKMLTSLTTLTTLTLMNSSAQAQSTPAYTLQSICNRYAHVNACQQSALLCKIQLALEDRNHG